MSSELAMAAGNRLAQSPVRFPFGDSFLRAGRIREVLRNYIIKILIFIFAF